MDRAPRPIMPRFTRTTDTPNWAPTNPCLVGSDTFWPDQHISSLPYLEGEIAGLNDWGIMADVVRFPKRGDELGQLYARKDAIHTEIDTLKFARTVTQSRLESAQVHCKVEHLQGLVMGAGPLRCGAWRKNPMLDVTFEREASE